MEPLSPSIHEPRVRPSAWITLVVVALGLCALARMRFTILVEPAYGGTLRVLTLAALRSPELFALLGVLLACSLVTAVRALTRPSPRAFSAASQSLVLLAVAGLTAVLTALPPWTWIHSSLDTRPNMYADAHAVALFGTTALALQLPTLLLALADLRASRRPRLRSPSLYTFLAIATLASCIHLTTTSTDGLWTADRLFLSDARTGIAFWLVAAFATLTFAMALFEVRSRRRITRHDSPPRTRA